MTKPEQFKQEFLALLQKYNAEMSVREACGSYERWAEGVDFDFTGEVIDDNYVIYPTIEFGMHTGGKE